MRAPSRKRISAALHSLAVIALLVCSLSASAEDAGSEIDASLLQLEVFINRVTTGMVGEFRLSEDGTLMVREKELKEVGIRPNKEALEAGGWIALNRLPRVSYEYDEANQILYFKATDDYREPRQLNARGERDDADKSSEPARSSFGAYANYRLYTSFNNEKLLSTPSFNGVSGTFDTVTFSPFGNINHSFLVKSNSDFGTPETLRLSSSWNYYDQRSMMSYKVGDMITGGLQWTRPVYLGGVQFRRNFSLRPDLVTMPVPSFSGSAAVPSTLDVYTNGNRSYSADIPGGPFQINNLPLVSGPGTTRIVVRDASGREVAQDVPFYTSSQLLAPGLIDFSFEAGFTRNYFGIYSDDYGRDLLGSATVRWGISDKLTLEGHAEGGANLINGGIGATFALGRNLVSTAFAYSNMNGSDGYQVAASYEAEFNDWHLYLRSQRTFGDYQDIASTTAVAPLLVNGISAPINQSAAPPRAIDQVSLAFPVFDLGSFNVNFANVQQVDGANNQVAGISHSRPLFGGTAYLSGYVDIGDNRNYGVFIGFSRAFDNKTTASVSSSATNAGANLVAEVSRNEDMTPGSYGWRIVDSEGANTYRGAGASYRSSYGRGEASVQQNDNNNSVSASFDGAIALAGGNVFFTNQINDSFAVVDVGTENIEVTRNNRPIGKTGRSGKIIIPDMQSYTVNNIAVDPRNLPVNTTLTETDQPVNPSRQTGVVIDFSDKSQGKAAIIGFIGGNGEPIPLGSSVVSAGSENEETIGYDGQAFLSDLAAHNRVEITLPSGDICHATFDFKLKSEKQEFIEGVICK